MGSVCLEAAVCPSLCMPTHAQGSTTTLPLRHLTAPIPAGTIPALLPRAARPMGPALPMPKDHLHATLLHAQ